MFVQPEESPLGAIRKKTTLRFFLAPLFTPRGYTHLSHTVWLKCATEGFRPSVHLWQAASKVDLTIAQHRHQKTPCAYFWDASSLNKTGVSDPVDLRTDTALFTTAQPTNTHMCYFYNLFSAVQVCYCKAHTCIHIYRCPKELSSHTDQNIHKQHAVKLRATFSLVKVTEFYFSSSIKGSVRWWEISSKQQ